MTKWLASINAARDPALTVTQLSDQYKMRPIFKYDSLPNIDLNDFVITQQIQASGGNWSSPTTTTHQLSVSEDTFSTVALSNLLTPGSWEVRARLGLRPWSTTLPFTLVAWTPTVISPNIWFEPVKGGLFQSNAGSGAAASSNNDVVGCLPDQSGNALSLVSVADNTTRPTLQGVGVNPYLNFDGSNDVLRVLSGMGSFAAGATTWAIALRGVSDATSARVMADANTSIGGPIYSLLEVDATTATSAATFMRNDSGTSIGTGSPSGSSPTLTNVFDGNDHVVIVTDDGSTIRTYLDGTAGPSLSYTRNGSTLTSNVFALGALVRSTDASSIGNYWAGRIYAGFVVNSVISSGNRANAFTYLGNRAGLSL